MSLVPQTFTGITAAKFESLVSRIKAATGLVIEDNAGVDTAKGYTLSWNYDPVTETLIVKCLNKPFLIPGVMVQEKLAELVNGA